MCIRDSVCVCDCMCVWLQCVCVCSVQQVMCLVLAGLQTLALPGSENPNSEIRKGWLLFITDMETVSLHNEDLSDTRHWFHMLVCYKTLVSYACLIVLDIRTVKLFLSISTTCLPLARHQHHMLVSYMTSAPHACLWLDISTTRLSLTRRKHNELSMGLRCNILTLTFQTTA